MQFLADNIDQLDLALDQLAIGDRNFDRFALMLIDNVVELTLHQFAKDCLAANDAWGVAGELKHDPKLVNKALSQSFDNKVKAARDLGLCDGQLCETLLYLHSFRNTAYHQGLRHERILHSLAIFYFISACDFLLGYRPMFYGCSSRDVYSHRARKYIGNEQLYTGKEAFQLAYTRLREVASSMEFNLVDDLALDMNVTIDDTDEMLRFLANDGPEKMTRDQVIIDVQAWDFAFTDEGKKFAKDNACSEKSVGEYVGWLGQNYKWPFSSDPIRSWGKRLLTLRKQTNPHKALKCYCDFIRQTEFLRSKVSHSAELLNAHINDLVDELRGK